MLTSVYPGSSGMMLVSALMWQGGVANEIPTFGNNGEPRNKINEKTVLHGSIHITMSMMKPVFYIKALRIIAVTPKLFN